MLVRNKDTHFPIYELEPDFTGNKFFRVYNFEGDLPHHSDLLVPHRKDYYLLAFIRKAGGTRQWIDMVPYVLQDNAVYFSGPSQAIVKEEFKQLWSTGIAFTKEFLSLQNNESLSRLPLITNPHNGHELLLTEDGVRFVEDILVKINNEYFGKSEWQQQMLSAYLTVLLTYLSRLYTQQYQAVNPSAEALLLKRFQDKINQSFKEMHEVGGYASLLNISAGHLSEVIKLHTGKPAIKHIHERLVLEARRQLFHTEDALKEIAYDLGFTDASYFNRFFKRETGVTPNEYRANIRKMYH